MALSNYDTLAVNEKGESINGVLVTPLGVRVEIYKNWLYVYDSAAWRKGGAFVKPCIAEIQHGELRYLDLSVCAVRGPQDGVYVVAWYDEQEIHGIAGCGVVAYVGNALVGVLRDSIGWFQAKLRKFDVPTMFQNLDFADAKRCNQGDRFLARGLGLPSADTPVGAQAPVTILSKLVK
jgi:hypothetical protein